MRAALLLALAAAATADEAAIAKAREAIPELIALGRGAPADRFAARDALAVAGPPAIARLIVEAGGNPSLRLLLEGVSHDLGAGVVAPALPLLGSKDPKVRAMAAASLGAAGAGGEAGVKQLVAALHDPDPEVRREGALAIGGIGRGAHDAIPGLIHLANDPERGMTREALLALGMIVRDAAERGRPAPKPTADVSGAIELGLQWLVAHQQSGGFWAVPGSTDTPKARAHVAALAILAMLESGAPERYAPQLRSGLRVLLADERASEPVTAALCAAARVLDEPECRAAAERAVATLTAGDGPCDLGWGSLALLEADFAGVLSDQSARTIDMRDGPVVDTALVLLASRTDPRSERVRELIDSCGHAEWSDLELCLLAARARWYAGANSDALADPIRKRQAQDGSWITKKPDTWGTARRTAAALLCLEAASGLAHPLTMPLPDAPQLKAAVATLRIAAQSKDEAIRAAAEQALAGFAVR